MDILLDGTDLISVIVPFLNGGAWLIEALQSVIAQTYTNWELIVIDDGSETVHSNLAKDFCRRYPQKMIYTEHEEHRNKGVSASRNEAAKLARGNYLAFLDADDKWLPHKLAQQLGYMKDHPQASLACEGIIKWYSWHDDNAADYVQPVGVVPGKCYAPRRLTKLLYPFTDAAPPAPSGFMVKRTVFENIGGFEAAYHGIYELYEDQAFLAKIYLHETVYVADTANVMYRKREGSMCSAANDVERYHIVRSFFFNWFERYVRTHQITDTHIRRLLQKAKKELMQAPALQTVYL